MADLVIRGMEMPETCGLCQLCLDDSRICNGYCMFFHRRVNMMERDKNCPIISLTEGHGRLGDLDALMNNIGDVPYKGAVRRVLMSAPTIIEADLEWKMKNCCCFSNTGQAEGGTDNG